MKVFVMWMYLWGPMWEITGFFDTYDDCVHRAAVYLEMNSYGEDAEFLCWPREQNPNRPRELPSGSPGLQTNPR
jgi:hypothetical protein